MVDNKADLALHAQTALREKIAAFLEAYRDTAYSKYVVFRDPETICAADDPRLETLTAMVAQLCDNATGPRPGEPLALVEVLWRAYYSEGVGPFRPGPLLDEIDWDSSHATLRTLPTRQIVPHEWLEDAGGESHLHKEILASRRALVNIGVLQVAIPNAVGAAEIVKRDGALAFADVEIVGRAKPDPPHPLILRFYWDPAQHKWLPLHAVRLWNYGWKPFLW